MRDLILSILISAFSFTYLEALSFDPFDARLEEQLFSKGCPHGYTFCFETFECVPDMDFRGFNDNYNFRRFYEQGDCEGGCERDNFPGDHGQNIMEGPITCPPGTIFCFETLSCIEEEEDDHYPIPPPEPEPEFPIRCPTGTILCFSTFECIPEDFQEEKECKSESEVDEKIPDGDWQDKPKHEKEDKYTGGTGRPKQEKPTENPEGGIKKTEHDQTAGKGKPTTSPVPRKPTPTSPQKSNQKPDKNQPSSNEQMKGTPETGKKSSQTQKNSGETLSRQQFKKKENSELDDAEKKKKEEKKAKDEVTNQKGKERLQEKLKKMSANRPTRSPKATERKMKVEEVQEFRDKIRILFKVFD